MMAGDTPILGNHHIYIYIERAFICMMIAGLHQGCAKGRGPPGGCTYLLVVSSRSWGVVLPDLVGLEHYPVPINKPNGMEMLFLMIFMAHLPAKPGFDQLEPTKMGNLGV